MQVSYGNSGDFNALVYGQKHQGTLNFLNNQVNQVMEMSKTMTDAGRSFFSTARELFDEFTGSDAVRRARAAVRRAGSMFQRNEISFISDVGRMQTAPIVMQRWIMAEPTLRGLFHDQRCDGYSESYVDMQPGAVGLQHSDYRRIISGVVMPDDENDCKITICVEPDGPDNLDDPDPTIEQKADILSTWEAIRSVIDHLGEDPTSIYGNKL